MILSDTFLDAAIVASAIAALLAVVRVIPEKSESGKSRLRIILGFRDNETFFSSRRVPTCLFSILIIIFSVGYRSFGLLNTHEDSRSNVVYSNSINAEVSYYQNGIVFTGGKEVNSAETAIDFSYRAGIKEFDHKIVLKKNHTAVTRKVDRVEILGDKSGKVVKIEYGRKSHYNQIFGNKINIKSESIVKIYLKESESVSNDRAQLEKLLELK